MGFGLNIDVGGVLQSLPGVGRFFGKDDPYGDWLLQQQYNTPLNQMKRLEEAGLNPNLIYANGVSNTATSAIRAKDGGLKLGIGYNTDPANAEVQRQLLNKQLGLLDEREIGVKLQNDTRRIQNQILQKQLDFYEDTGLGASDNSLLRVGGRVYQYAKKLASKNGVSESEFDKTLWDIFSRVFFPQFDSQGLQPLDVVERGGF